MSSNGSDNKRESKPFEPLAWGILFFTFWLTLKVVNPSTPMMNWLAWFSVVASALLWLSLILPPWEQLLMKPRVKKIYLPIVFLIAMLGYEVGWISSLPTVKGVDFNVSFWFGFVWTITYLLILIRVSKRAVVIPGCALFAIIGIFDIVESNILAGVVLIVLGTVGTYISIKQPDWLWHESIEI